VTLPSLRPWVVLAAWVVVAAAASPAVLRAGVTGLLDADPPPATA
jgi:hypothetical protein